MKLTLVALICLGLAIVYVNGGPARLVRRDGESAPNAIETTANPFKGRPRPGPKGPGGKGGDDDEDEDDDDLEKREALNSVMTNQKRALKKVNNAASNTESIDVIDKGEDGGVPKAAKADFDMTYWCSHGAGNSQICLWPPNDGSISVYGLSTDEVQLVLQVHNECRKMLAEKYGAILSTMGWSQELAMNAQKYGQTCPNQHDSGDNRIIPGMAASVGQNIAFGQADWREAIEEWCAEEKNFKLGGPNDANVVGHLTQMANKESNQVGCGFARCNGEVLPNIYICNYAKTQTQSIVDRPFETGTPCESCSGHCNNDLKLCDCGAVVCEHSGHVVKSDTCTCECHEMYAGSANCSTVSQSWKDDNCDTDQSDCGTANLPVEYCSYEQMYQDWCPTLCKEYSQCP